MHDTCMSFHESGVEQLKRFTETQRGELLTPWRNKLGEVAPNVDTKCFDMAQECFESVGEYVWQVCLVTSTLFYCGVQRRVDGELPRREVSPTR